MRVTLESQFISPECVATRGEDGAWGEAVRRLREVYDAQRKRKPDGVLVLIIERVSTQENS